jgi:hypothetical protein
MDTCDPRDSKSNIKYGWFSSCPTADEILFIAQILVLFIVVCTSIYNLSAGNGDSNLWTALLTSSIGYVMPNPKVKKSRIVQSLSASQDNQSTEI